MTPSFLLLGLKNAKERFFFFSETHFCHEIEEPESDPSSAHLKYFFSKFPDLEKSTEFKDLLKLCDHSRLSLFINLLIVNDILAYYNSNTGVVTYQ